MIAKSGNSTMKILTASKPTPQETYIAKELRHYLNLMTCASFSIISESEAKSDEPVFAIGMAAKQLGLTHDETLGDNGFIVRTVGNSVAITGGKRGLIYGVYELLEHMGCRFFTALCEKIPNIPDLTLPQFEINQKPILEYRLHSYKDIQQNQRFAVKCRVNALELREEYGGGMTYVPGWFVHTFDNIISPDEYFDSNPEYFSMVNGERKKEFSQLCLTNPDVLRIAVEKVGNALRNAPGSNIISVSPNDWYSFCTCPDCAAIDEREESNAGSLIWFVNQIAERIEEEFPDAVIETLAYQYSRQVPKHIRSRHNVCVRLCSIEACFTHSFETCDDVSRKTAKPNGERMSFIEDLCDWAKVCDRLYIMGLRDGFRTLSRAARELGGVTTEHAEFHQQ
jgi:hypothetical protein